MSKLIPLLFVFVAVSGFLTLLTADVPVEADDAELTKPYEMVSELHVVMEYIDEIFMEIPDKVKANRVRKIRTEAMFLAELTNVSSYAKDFRKEKGWLGYMKSMREDFLAMSEAAKKKETETITKLHKKITNTCDTCHENIRDA